MDEADFIDLNERAKNNEVDAQNEIAARYATGDGVEKDLSLAIFWYKKAAKELSSEALYNLGLMYLFGEGVNQDQDTAVNFLIQAADCGSADACLAMGEALRLGNLGLRVDYEKSTKYYLKAGRLGAVNGFREVGKLLEEKKIGVEYLADTMKNFTL